MSNTKTPARARAPIGSGTVVLQALWFGLLTGLLELGMVRALKSVRDPSPGLFRMNRHIVWMIPSFNVALFLVIGALLVVFTRIRKTVSLRIIVAPLSAVGFLTLLLTYSRLYVTACVFLACGLAHILSRAVRRNEARFRKLVALTLPVFGMAALGIAGASYYHNVASGWRPSTNRPPAPSGAPNVLLIVLDTVRADRLSLYGYHRPTSPNMERLAARGVRFDRARSTAPWTLPSHASMMTGRWPHQLSGGFHGPLDATYPTLAEFLNSKGYDTAGFVANLIYATVESGIGRGFTHYEDHDISLGGILRALTLIDRSALLVDHRKSANLVGNQVLTWLGKNPRDRPFFAFLNLFDAHSPYSPPDCAERHFGVRSESAKDHHTIINWFFLQKKSLEPRQIQLVNDAYDDSIAYLDAELGRLMDELEQRGHMENTLLIVTADHGEHFGEHDLYGHASSLYDPEIHVPLFVVPPRGEALAGRIVAPSVSLRDIPATVVDFANLDGSPFPGNSLVPYFHGEVVTPALVLSEVAGPASTTANQQRSPAFRGSMQSLVANEKIYILNGDGVEELYDLEDDPNQFNNLINTPEAPFFSNGSGNNFGNFLPPNPNFGFTNVVVQCPSSRIDIKLRDDDNSIGHNGYDSIVFADL